MMLRTTTKRNTKKTTRKTVTTNLTIIRQISVVGGVCLSGTVSISKKTVRTIRSKLDQCVAPNLTMCLLYLSVYGCCQLTELNDFLVVFYKLRIIGNSADGSAICCIIGERHRAVLTEGRHREQLADNCRADHPEFTVCNNNICAMCIAQNWYLADSLPFVLGSL